MNKDKFRSLLKLKCKNASFKYLLNEKATRSKITKIEYTELKIQPYLMSVKINIRKKQLLFKLRTRMMSTPENIGQNKVCKICQIDRDTTNHTISCIFLKCQVSESLNLDSNSMDDIYGIDLDKTFNFLTVFEMMWRKREEILQRINSARSERDDS